MHAHQLLGRLPRNVQRRAIDAVMRLGAAPRFGLFQMFVRTLVEIGADRDELLATLRSCRDIGPSFRAAFRALSKRTTDPYRACVYALVADWSASGEERRINYELAIPRFEAFARGAAIERVRVPFRDSALAGYVAAAPGDRGILFVPGNDEPKEWMVPMAEAARALGLTALVIDPPGYGESQLFVTRLDGPDALRECATRCCDVLAERGVTRVATFGVSLGGLLAHELAAFEPRIGASAGIGGPFDLRWLLGHIPFVQRDRLAQACGGDPHALVAPLDPRRVLANHRRPALVIHGDHDEVVPPRDGEALAAVLHAELRSVHGDHMANPKQRDETAYALAWLAARI